jgi:hypothetical protein
MKAGNKKLYTLFIDDWKIFENLPATKMLTMIATLAPSESGCYGSYTFTCDEKLVSLWNVVVEAEHQRWDSMIEQLSDPDHRVYVENYR